VELSELWKRTKSYLFTGALVMVPLFITLYIVLALIRFIGGHVGLGHGLAASVVGLLAAFVLVLAAGIVTQHAIGSRKSLAFQQAVLLEYPRTGLYAVAFVTRDGHKSGFIPDSEDMLHVFLPTTPNPTSGFFLIVPKRDTIALNISVEDAFKLIISGGIVTSEPNKQT